MHVIAYEIYRKKGTKSFIKNPFCYQRHLMLVYISILSLNCFSALRYLFASGAVGLA